MKEIKLKNEEDENEKEETEEYGQISISISIKIVSSHLNNHLLLLLQKHYYDSLFLSRQCFHFHYSTYH